MTTHPPIPADLAALGWTTDHRGRLVSADGLPIIVRDDATEAARVYERTREQVRAGRKAKQERMELT